MCLVILEKLTWGRMKEMEYDTLGRLVDIPSLRFMITILYDIRKPEVRNFCLTRIYDFLSVNSLFKFHGFLCCKCPINST